MNPLSTPLVAALLAALAASASAQTVYRCGNAYSSVACPDARAVVIASAVSAEQRAEARDVVRREKALALEMTRDRRAQEAQLRPALAGSLSAPRVAPAPAPVAKKHARKAKKAAPLDPDRDFVATVPKTKKAGA